jgi:serine protease 16
LQAGNCVTGSQQCEFVVGDGLIDIPAQGNDPSCTEPGCPNIATLCDTLVTAANKSNVTALQVLADYKRASSQLQQQGKGDDGECSLVDWTETLSELFKPEVTDEGERSWLWQTCTEVGFYQTCDETCPYASFFHLVDMDLELCRVAFNVTNVYDNVQASLEHYGGLDISGGSRVLSVNGNVDPWSVLGLQKSPKYSLPVQLVDGASHHFWTHPVNATDAVEIVQIRDYIYSVVMEWLGVEDRTSSGSRSGSGISGGSSSSLRAGRVMGGDYSSVLEESAQ